jgi:O6-methylguanine-DNA--protein-cysteine methyltransferase
MVKIRFRLLHRVIGANGRLTGFAGGLEAKAYLLKLENHIALF